MSSSTPIRGGRGSSEDGRGGGGKRGLLSRLKKRTQSENESTSHSCRKNVGSGGGDGSIDLAGKYYYNQPLRPEDAILTPSGGYVDKRWLLEGGGPGMEGGFGVRGVGSGNGSATLNISDVAASSMTSSSSTVATTGTKSKSFRLWKSVLKKCRKMGGGKQNKRPPKCVIKRAATWDYDDEDVGLGGTVLKDGGSGGQRKCSNQSDLKLSKEIMFTTSKLRVEAGMRNVRTSFRLILPQATFESYRVSHKSVYPAKHGRTDLIFGPIELACNVKFGHT
jgi:hypothetical protein